MAWSFFILGIILMGMTGIIYSVINYQYKFKTLIYGFAASFILIAMSFCFSSSSHLMAYIKYDNVIVADYLIGTNPTIDIDPSKIVYVNDYVSFRQIYRYVIMAWNDESPAKQYDKLIER